MATITDYATLQSAIADYLNRADLSSQIQTFIQLVESDLNTRLRSREMIVRATTTSDQEYVEVPSDWLEAISLKLVNGKSPLRYVTLDEADHIVSNLSFNNTNSYSLMDSAIRLVPSPPDDVSIEMVYYGKIPALSSLVTSNWLLAKAPDLYLYGALANASPFLMDDQRLPVFGQIYLSRVESMREEAEKSLHSGSPLVMRTRRTFS